MSKVRIDVPLEKIAAFCKKWRVREFSLFGSVLRDDFGPGSDVDVLVSFERNPEISLWDLSEMADELATLYGRNVDLVVKEGLENPFRRKAILTTREILYAA